MDRVATGALIALASVAMTGGFTREVLAESSFSARPAVVQSKSSPQLVIGPRSERVMSLLLTLEALRAEPNALHPAKD